ncbi:MAG: serine hydrolase [Bacteroidota bacterium]
MKSSASIALSTPERYRLPQQLERHINDMMQEALVPGLSIAIYSKDGILFNKGMGVKSLETKEPVDEQTIFCAASLGKPVFTYGVLRLVDQGILDLDKPLYEYMPHRDLLHDERHKQITGRMVLSHTTGLPNWRGARLDFESDPGQQYVYSGEGFLYLMEIVEKLTGQSLDEMMSEQIFEPLGMTRSSYTWREEFEDNYAFSHDEFGRVLSRYKPAEQNAAFSLQTTAQDYSRLMIAALNGWGLEQETSRQMLSSAIELVRSAFDGSRACWGLGFGLLETQQDRYLWQWGGHNWFSSLTVALQERGLGMVYFSNNTLGFGLGKGLLKLCFGEEWTPQLWLDDYDYEAPVKQLFRDIRTGSSFDDAIKPYLAENGRHQKTEWINEEAMYTLGELLRDNGALEWSRRILYLNQKAYPDSAATQEQYALAALLCRRPEEAARHYGYAYQLDTSRKEALKNSLRLSDQVQGNVTLQLAGHDYARWITIAGEFNDWNKYADPFVRKNGQWVCQLNLPPGTYKYKLVVDDIWKLDPHNPKMEFDGQHNSILEVE